MIIHIHISTQTNTIQYQPHNYTSNLRLDFIAVDEHCNRVYDDATDDPVVLQAIVMVERLKDRLNN